MHTAGGDWSKRPIMSWMYHGEQDVVFVPGEGPLNLMNGDHWFFHEHFAQFDWLIYHSINLTVKSMYLDVIYREIICQHVKVLKNIILRSWLITKDQGPCKISGSMTSVMLLDTAF